MIYTEITKRAIKLCFKAHAGQFDKSGIPYAHHPLHLAEQMEDEDSTIVALLHDVVEDTNDYNLLQRLSENNEPSKQLRDTSVIKAEAQ